MRLVVSSISFEIRSFSSSEVSGSQLDDAGFVRGDVVGDLLFEPLAAGAQLVVRKGFYRRAYRLDLLEVRLDLLAVFVGFRAEEKFD